MIPTPCIQPGCPRMAVGGPRAPRCRPCQRGWDWARQQGRAGYHAVHLRLLQQRGPASNYQCQHCSGPAAEWAYDHGDWAAQRPVGQPAYSLDLSRYVPMCVRCHRQLDRTIRNASKVHGG